MNESIKASAETGVKEIAENNPLNRMELFDVLKGIADTRT